VLIVFIVAPLMLYTGWRTDDHRLWLWGAVAGLVASVEALAWVRSRRAVS
jgi:hypothetical protein